MEKAEASFMDLFIDIKRIILDNVKVFIAIFSISVLLGLGIILRNSFYPEYSGQLLLKSETLNYSILSSLVGDMNTQLSNDGALMSMFEEKNAAVSQLSSLGVKSIQIKPADDKDKSLNIYQLDLVFAPEGDVKLDFDLLSKVLLQDIIDKAKNNVFVIESKLEIERNINDIDKIIEKAALTEEAMRNNVKNKEGVSIIGMSQFYADLSNLERTRSALLKSAVFFDDQNLVYKLTDFSFDYHNERKVVVFAYALFFGFFLCFIFVISKLLFK